MDFLLHIIKGNQSISKLIIHTGTMLQCVNTSQVKRLAREHPLLIEIDFRNYQFKTNDVITITKALTQLKKFNFCVNHHNIYKKIESKLDEYWQCNYIFPSHVVLNRRN